jgi:hypothetical protein
MVLDVSKYMFNHPGGKFVISHLIGRDIGKFFYGGQVLDNYKYAKPCNHSFIAQSIAKDILVCRLKKKAPYHYFKAKISRQNYINRSCSTFTFKLDETVSGV